jgi:endogenous inhibitor of DNA gyrase (YacG/DUF329 family)
MKVKEDYALDTQGRKRLFSYYTCDHCGQEYKKQTRLAHNSKYEHFCSTQCGTKANINSSYIELTCANCSLAFTRLKSKLPTSKHRVYFCSRACKDAGQSYITNIKPSRYGTGETRYREKHLNIMIRCALLMGLTMNTH